MYESNNLKKTKKDKIKMVHINFKVDLLFVWTWFSYFVIIYVVGALISYGAYYYFTRLDTWSYLMGMFQSTVISPFILAAILFESTVWNTTKKDKK